MMKLLILGVKVQKNNYFHICAYKEYLEVLSDCYIKQL